VASRSRLLINVVMIATGMGGRGYSADDLFADPES
jgi:hypothetical protein